MMPLSSDERNLIAVLSMSNLGNLTAPRPTIVIPAGLEIFFFTEVRNNLPGSFGPAPDIAEVTATLVVAGGLTVISR